MCSLVASYQCLSKYNTVPRRALGVPRFFWHESTGKMPGYESEGAGAGAGGRAYMDEMSALGS